MTIIGIDLSLNTGYAIIDDTELLDYGTINLHNSSKPLEKLYEDLNVLLGLHLPDLAIIEETYFSKNIKTIKLLSRIRGVADLAISYADITAKYITPSSARKKVLNSGNLSKKEVYDRLKLLYPNHDIYSKGYDISDALLLALAGI